MEKYRIKGQDNRIYSMGLTQIEGGIHVCVDAAGKSCSLVLYRAGSEERLTTIPFPEEGRMGNVWGMTVLGVFEELEYCYEVDGRMMPDPYGRAFTGRETWGDLSSVDAALRTPVIIREFDWEGDKPPRIPYEDCVVYRIHARGLTMHPSSKVSHRGTFQAVREKLPYFQELGVTTLELIPSYEFCEIMMPPGEEGNPYGYEKPSGKLNYWGYTPGYYFAPKASYSAAAKPAGDGGATGAVNHSPCASPIWEFKSLVKELHRAGMELVTELYFTGDENPSFVLDAVRFWVEEYHVDGIHLVGAAPVNLIGRDPYLSRTKLFATSWEGVNGGGVKHLGEYNDGFLIDMRRFLKGDEDQLNSLIYRSRRNPRDHAVINYIANTNGFTLMDMVSYDTKHNEANGENNQDGNTYNYSWNCGIEGPTRRKKILELRKKQIRNALLLLFLSEGTPLLLSGDEFGNSKYGNNNSYCQDNEISWLNWNQLKTNRDIYEFTKAAIAFRREHPVFRMPQEPRVMDYLALGMPDVSYHGVKAWCPEFDNFRRQLGILYNGEYAKRSDGAPDDSFFVAYNMHWEPHEFALPNLAKKRRWHIAFNTDAKEVNGIYPAGSMPLAEDQKGFKVPARTIVVFIGIVEEKNQK